MSYVLTNQTCSSWDHTYSILSGTITPNEPSPDYMRRFDEIICDFMKEQGIPGASLSLSLHGKPIYRQGYGISRAGERVSSSSHYRIASISKIITAIGILKLTEEGRLSLDDKIFGPHIGIISRPENLPMLTDWEINPVSGITVRHLLEHSAGWDRDQDGDHVFWYQNPKYARNINVWNNLSLVHFVLRHDLRFIPGTEHAYSNFGYMLLGMIIEEVTDMQYDDYIRSILCDIGVTDIHIGRTKQQPVDYREVCYFNNKDPQVELSVCRHEGLVVPQYGAFPIENTGAFGGWVTSADNLVKILNSLIMEYDTEHILSQESLDEMFTMPSFATDEAWYGLGLDIEDKGASFGHTGAMEGTSTTVHHNKNGLTWALLMNSWAKDMDLDGLVKFALSSISGLPLWQGVQPLKSQLSDYFVMAADTKECVRILLPQSEVYAHVTHMKSNGYMISNMNILSQAHEVLFNFVWKKVSKLVSKDWCICLDIKLEDFNEYLSTVGEKYMYVEFLESYRVKEDIMHAFVLVKEEGMGQKVYCVEDKERHMAILQQFNMLGYMLKSQSVLYTKDKVTISAVYDKVFFNDKKYFPEQEVWTDVNIEDFLETLGEYTNRNMHLDYLQFYTTDDMPRISAVWSCKQYVKHHIREGKNGVGIKGRLMTCHKMKHVVFQRHDVSKYGFLFELRESLNNNRPVLFVSAYEFEGVVYFGTIWERTIRTKTKYVKKKKNSINSIVDSDEYLVSDVQVKMEILE